MNDSWTLHPIMKHRGRPKSKYLKESKWWPVKYLGTVEAVKDWRAPGSRLELMAFIRSAQAANRTLSPSKVHTPRLLWISPEWLHVTDQTKKKLYALTRTEEIGSFCHASGEEGTHFLVIKVVNAKTSNNDCIILSTQDMVTIRHICEVLKMAVESALHRMKATVRHLMSLKQGHSKHDYEEIQLYGDTTPHSITKNKTNMSPLPQSTVQFLEAEARMNDYDIPVVRQSSTGSLTPSSVDSNWTLGPFSPSPPSSVFDDSPSSDIPPFAYDQPPSLDRKVYDIPRQSSSPPFHYRVPRLLWTMGQPEPEQIQVTYGDLEVNNTGDPQSPMYEPMAPSDEDSNPPVLTIIRKESLSREPIEEKIQRDSGHEEGEDTPARYEPLRVKDPRLTAKTNFMSDSQEDDSGLEDNDSVEIQIKADIHNEPTEFTNLVHHFAAGEDGDLYAIVEKPKQHIDESPTKQSYEEEREEFMKEVERFVPTLQFIEFQDIIYLYDEGEADLSAMARRARLLFRKDRMHLRNGMVKVIRPGQRQEFLYELEKQSNYIGRDDLISSLKKRKHSNPGRRVRFGTVRTDSYLMSRRSTSMESLNTDDSPSSDITCNDWGSKVMEELNIRLQTKLRTTSTRQHSPH